MGVIIKLHKTVIHLNIQHNARQRVDTTHSLPCYDNGAKDNKCSLHS